jgi:hypothetical protein
VKAKYEKGSRVTSLPEMIDGMYKGERYYLWHKVQSLGWLQNMSVHTLFQFVNSGRVWRAELARGRTGEVGGDRVLRQPSRSPEGK